MTFPERSAVATIVALVATFGTYVLVLSFGVDRSVDDFVYKPLLILTVVVLVAIMAVSHSLLAIVSPSAANAFDERDRWISQRADQLGGVLLGGVVLGVVGLTVFEVAHVLIANALLLGLVFAQLASEITKLLLYRRSS